MGKNGRRFPWFDRLMEVYVVAVCYGVAALCGYLAVRSILSRSWPAVPAVILVSTDDDVPGWQPHCFRVKYRYAWAGRVHESHAYSEFDLRSRDVADVDRLIRAFPRGSQRACYVNPGDPSDAVLQRPSPWTPAFYGLAAFLVGTGMVFKFRKARIARRGGTDSLLTDRREKAMIGAGLIALALVVYVNFFLSPMSRGLRSHGWRPIPCVIEAGQVRSEHTMWHTHYWADVVYRYEVAGVSYRSSTINGYDVGSPWYYSARRSVRRYSPGTRTFCHVNPADPAEAVLERTFSQTQLFSLGVLWAAVMGVVLIVNAITGRRGPVKMPLLLCTLAFGFGTATALTVFWITGADLIQDHGEGISDGLEWTAVSIAGLVSALLLAGWILLAARHPDQPSRATEPGGLWDQEIDRRPDRKHRLFWFVKKSGQSTGKRPAKPTGS